MKKLLSLFTLMLLPLFSFSEDIELYIGNASQRAESRPQVLLIVDTSGSMRTNYETIKTPYNPAREYRPLTGGFSDSGNAYLYYVVGISDSLPNVDAANENRRFLASINNCTTARSRLNEVGFYTGRIREYRFEGNTGGWEEIPESDGSSISIIDCEDDITLDLSNIGSNSAVQHNLNEVIDSEGTSTVVTGYPIDGAGSNANPEYYQDDIRLVNSSWGGETVTIYTDKYLRWKQGTHYSDGEAEAIGNEDLTRMEIAKATLANIVEAIPSVDFGLQVFNANAIVGNISQAQHDADQTQPHGGKIAFDIQEMTASAKVELLDIINTQLRGAGSTPLCESYYEAYRYFSGQSVMYGDQDINTSGNNGHRKNSPRRDSGAEVETDDSETDDSETDDSESIYESPYVGCSNEIFVILITDGLPRRDNAADQSIIALQTDGSSASPIQETDTDGNVTTTNYLPVLAEYMHNNDINATMDGKQIATLSTVGFSSGAEGARNLLQSAASYGGGSYFDATDANQLGAQIQRAISSILEVSSSFTTPSVATNSFDRTETQDSAYYTMFIPESGARWKGNLKKLKLENNIQVDRLGEPAIGLEGNILASAKTFWISSSEADGNNVEAGGVVGMFNNKENTRKVLSDIGVSLGSELPPLTVETMSNYYVENSTDLISIFGVDNDAEAQEYVDWALGLDVDDADSDNNTTDHRPDLFGDPLHSKPVVINYGGSEENPNIRIIVGTNSGVLHMFRDSGLTVDESWAFMPKKFFSNIKPLRDNLPSADKVYGIDGPITSFVLDSNGDGTISGTDEKAWIFFGLRRGGSSYYALDVTNPDEPEYMWEISPSTNGFEQLGQTWSQPVVTYSKINIVDGEPKPVLIFGAGYSIAKDAPGPGNHDIIGQGIYMVDAETGNLLWSTTSEASNEKNTQFDEFTDSIPSKIAILDSDSDGFVDRLYTGDTGGNVFRVDMPAATPFDDDEPWTIFKLAELGGDTNENDRRFFNEPTVVRTFFTDTVRTTIEGSETVVSQERPYDAILIGSGDRSTPTALDTNDKFFMLRDENIITQSFITNVPTKIVFDDSHLHDFTDNPYGSTSNSQNLDLEVSQKSGWYFNYSTGERSTASALVVNGEAIFTSFVPGTASGSSCSLTTGNGFLYAINLFDGTTSYDTRRTLITSTIPDTPILMMEMEMEMEMEMV